MQVLLPVALLASAAAANPVATAGYTCHEFLVDIPVTNVTVVTPPLPPITNKYQSTSYAQLLSMKPSGSTPPPQTTTLTKTFKISGDVCTPNNPGPKASTLQLLTHGLGFNRSYWDFYLPGSDNQQYSHVHAATAAGYSTLSWNRLGLAPSTVADPYTEIQALVELDILISLTKLARAGKIPGLPKPPSKIINVGHSFGSELTIGLAAVAPDITDGVVITGLAGEQDFGILLLAASDFVLANQNQPARFPKDTYSDGFLTWSSEYQNQYIFFNYPNFDPAVLAASEAMKQPLSFGEIFASGALPTAAPSFKNPVLFLASENDFTCFFNCNNAFGNGSMAFNNFNGSQSVEAHIQPGAGHALPLHKNVTASYVALDSWIVRHFGGQ